MFLFIYMLLQSFSSLIIKIHAVNEEVWGQLPWLCNVVSNSCFFSFYCEGASQHGTRRGFSGAQERLASGSLKLKCASELISMYFSALFATYLQP